MSSSGIDPEDFGIPIETDNTVIEIVSVKDDEPIKETRIVTDKSIALYSFGAKNVSKMTFDTVQLLAPEGIRVLSDLPSQVKPGTEFVVELQIDTSRSYATGVQIKVGILDINEIPAKA